MRLHPGETEAVGWRVVTVRDAVRQLRDASPDVTGRPWVIAIDGRGGAGKTTLAERLRQAVPHSAVVHTDDVFWKHACFDWGPLLLEHVLWVEGTGIIREELTPWLDASVWMQGDLDEQERLLVARDGDSPEQLEHVVIDHDRHTELVIAPPTGS